MKQKAMGNKGRKLILIIVLAVLCCVACGKSENVYTPVNSTLDNTIADSNNTGIEDNATASNNVDVNADQGIISSEVTVDSQTEGSAIPSFNKDADVSWGELINLYIQDKELFPNSISYDILNVEQKEQYVDVNVEVVMDLSVSTVAIQELLVTLHFDQPSGAWEEKDIVMLKYTLYTPTPEEDFYVSFDAMNINGKPYSIVKGIGGQSVSDAYQHIGEYNAQGTTEACDGEYYGIINASGNVVRDFWFSEIYFTGVIAVARETDKWGIIDANGNYLYEPSADNFFYVGPDHIALEYISNSGKKHLVVNNNGKEIVPLGYSKNISLVLDNQYIYESGIKEALWGGGNLYTLDGTKVEYPDSIRPSGDISHIETVVEDGCWATVRFDIRYGNSYTFLLVDNLTKKAATNIKYYTAYNDNYYAILDEDSDDWYVYDKKGNRIAVFSRKIDSGLTNNLHIYDYFAVSELGSGYYLYDYAAQSGIECLSYITIPYTDCFAVQDTDTNLWGIWDKGVLAREFRYQQVELMEDEYLVLSRGNSTETYWAENVPVDETKSLIDEIESIYATSELSEKNVTHEASYICDGDLTTCWCEGASGLGIGESVTWSFGKERNIVGYTIYNGYLKSKDHYSNNAIPTVIEFKFLDENGKCIVSEEFTLDDIDFEEAKEGTYLDFQETVKAYSVTMEIENAKIGSKYEDTCISELAFWEYK